MVNVVCRFNGDFILDVDISGHALSGDHGQDLVCAGVSSISVGTLNALNELCNDTCDLTMEEAHVHIKVKDINCDKTQLILNTMYIQLLTIQEVYKNNIKINRK